MSGEILLTMNFQENAIMLNEGVLDALQRPQQVQLMVNEEDQFEEDHKTTLLDSST